MHGLAHERTNAHPAQIVALFLVHEGLDCSRAFVTDRANPPPKGSMRVRWLAKKVRDLTRDARTATT